MDFRMAQMFSRRDAILSVYDNSLNFKLEWERTAEMSMSRWNILAKSPDQCGAPICEFSGRSWFLVYPVYHCGSPSAARAPIQLQRSDAKCFYVDKGSLRYHWGSEDMGDTPGIFPTCPAEMYEYLSDPQLSEYEQTFMFRYRKEPDGSLLLRESRSMQRYALQARELSTPEQVDAFQVFQKQRGHLKRFLSYVKDLLRSYCSSARPANKEYYWTNYTAILLFYINTVGQVALNDMNLDIYLRYEKYNGRFLAWYYPMIDVSQVKSLSDEELLKLLHSAMSMVGMACPECGEMPGCREFCPSSKCFQAKQKAHEQDASDKDKEKERKSTKYSKRLQKVDWSSPRSAALYFARNQHLLHLSREHVHDGPITFGRSEEESASSIF
jgi:hypothetical protein